VKPVHLLWFIPLAGAFGLAVPRDLELKAPESEPVTAEPRTAQAQSLGWYGGETVLERESDGHFYAEAYADGAPVRFLVDTGASMVALTGDDAYALGLYWDEADMRVIGQGANGPVRGVPVTIGEVELGGLRSTNVRAVIVPAGLPVSLLGQSFLSRVGNVEIAGDRMVLADAG